MRLFARKSVAVSIAGVGLIALAGGCTSSGGPVGRQGSPSGGPLSNSPSNATGGRPDATSSVHGSDGLAILPCLTSGLRVATGTPDGEVGALDYPLEFVNTSGRTCTLDGYPRVALTTRMAPGSQVGAAAGRNDDKPALVITLARDATASATLRILFAGDYLTSRCGPVTVRYLQVYPPGQEEAVYLPFTGQGCSKPVLLMEITTVEAGTSG